MCDCDRAAELTSATSTNRMRIASWGHACTQAGASPTASGRCTCRTSARCRVDANTSERRRDTSARSTGSRCTGHRDAARCPSSVLFVGQHRAAVQTGGFNAMMARRRDRLLVRLRRSSTPVSNPTLRQVSSSSSPLSEWQALTQALQPVQASRSTAKAYCSPGRGLEDGIRSR